jgi:ATP-GRASP peptide maturase of grasp-with-spasm system
MSIRIGRQGAKLVLTNEDGPFDLSHASGSLTRHGYLAYRPFPKFLKDSEFPELYDNLQTQHETIEHFLYYHIRERLPGIGFAQAQDSNKLIALKVAADHGLAIPDTLVTSSRDTLLQFAGLHRAVVCKSVQNVVHLAREDEVHINYTEILDDSVIETLPERFFPSKFQELIPKHFEVRTFFLDGECHSMAIFSQRDRQTQVDFRKYNDAYPNRCVPFKLPASIEDKICKLMQTLDLDTGSIDLIRSTKGEFVFLEVNPVGQFGMVSYPCNYGLEELMAKALTRRMGRN